jgi:hypothetical protein
MNKLLIYFTAISLIIGFIAAAPNYTRLEPEWARYPAVKAVDRSLGVVLGDIESHLPSGHPYKESDRVTWAHESTHGINSYIRNEYQGKVNALYCLHDRAVVLLEPNTTISNIARYVPNSLRGQMYQNYLVGQESWNKESLYIFDEWVSYTNGTAAGLDLARTGRWQGGQRSDTVQYMLEFDVLALCVAYVVDPNNVIYGDNSNFKAFLRWNLRRSIQLYRESKKYQEFTSSSHDAWLENLRTAPDAEGLRTFAKNYLGTEWTRQIYGF